VDARAETRERIRREPPLVRMWDGDWNLRGVVRGEFEASFDWVLNDTGQGNLVLPADHHLAIWAMDFRGRSTKNLHITVDKDGARWSGRASSVATTRNADGEQTTTIEFLSDYEELKHILVWPNPFTPAALQFPRVWGLAGPAVWTLKLTLMVNLLRMQGNLWALPDDPLDFNSWTQSLDYKRWPIVVKPGALLLDDSEWTILQSRFDTFHEMAADTLADGGLMVECRRWLPGDPQPWAGANLWKAGQLVIDIVDKSGWFGQTAVGGTVLGGLSRTLLEVADDLVDDVRADTGTVLNAPSYAVSGFLGVSPEQPWVVYRDDGTTGGSSTSTTEETTVTWTPATIGQVVVGGTSMPGINEGMEAAVQLIGQTVANYFLVPNLAEPAWTMLKPMFEDTILAFASYKGVERTSQMGWSHYLEDFGGNVQAYTLSGVLAMRSAWHKTREKVTATAKIGDGRPYLVGDHGQGHFFLGDRIGVQVPTDMGGGVVVEQVSKLTLDWSATDPHTWEITVGDLEGDHDPVTAVTSKTKALASLLKEMGLT
jgi:hypothetical protein